MNPSWNRGLRSLARGSRHRRRHTHWVAWTRRHLPIYFKNKCTYTKLDGRFNREILERNKSKANRQMLPEAIRNATFGRPFDSFVIRVRHRRVGNGTSGSAQSRRHGRTGCRHAHTRRWITCEKNQYSHIWTQLEIIKLIMIVLECNVN